MRPGLAGVERGEDEGDGRPGRGVHHLVDAVEGLHAVGLVPRRIVGGSDLQ